MTGFRYGRDPLCIAACLLYLLNSLWLRRIVGGPFWTGYFNDLLLIPAALPWLLWFMKRMGLREGGCFPTGMEIFVCGTVWAVVIEGLLPLALPRATADWMDVSAYAAGGLFAWLWWKYAACAGRSVR